MLRRDLLAAAAAGLIPSFHRAGAEERARRIGVLISAEPRPQTQAGWLAGLRERGWVDGGNLQISYRSYEGRYDRVPGLTAELVAGAPELIVVLGGEAALAVRAVAPGVPLVFVNVVDPVGLGLVESLAHPGGNATGVAAVVPEGFRGKAFSLIKEFVPAASRIALLTNRQNRADERFRTDNADIEQRLKIKLIIVEASAPEQFATAFELAKQSGAQAIVVAGEPLYFLHRNEIVALAAQHRLPALYISRQIALDGGLMSFGPDGAATWRRVGPYVDKILRGAKPAEVPVEQPTKYHITVNRKTADALGLVIPPAILAQADEVIE